MSRFCTFAMMLAVAGSAWSAETLGRFFFTPAERAELDAARHRKAPPPPPLPAAAPAPPPAAAVEVEEPPPASQVLTYRGLVKRSDGKATVWLNNKPMDANEALEGLPLPGQVRPDGAVSLVDPHTGRRIDLKVGQSIALDPTEPAGRRRAQRANAPRTAPPAAPAAPRAQPADQGTR